MTAVVPIVLHGDCRFQSGHGVTTFSDDGAFQRARPAVLSTVIHPDFEIEEVFVALARLESEAVQGVNLDDAKFEIPSSKDKHVDYDTELRSHMIYHLTNAHHLPALR